MNQVKSGTKVTIQLYIEANYSLSLRAYSDQSLDSIFNHVSCQSTAAFKSQCKAGTILSRQREGEANDWSSYMFLLQNIDGLRYSMRIEWQTKFLKLLKQAIVPATKPRAFWTLKLQLTKFHPKPAFSQFHFNAICMVACKLPSLIVRCVHTK